VISNLSLLQASALFSKLSNLAYLPPKQAMKEFMAQGDGFDGVFVSTKGSDCYILHNQYDIVVVCRGTEIKQLNDIVTDVNIDRVHSVYEYGLVHEGFLNYTNRIWENVKASVLDQGGDYKNVWFTGHSLGAAMATLMAGRFAAYPYLPTPKALFTYGSPRVGNRSFINVFNELPVTHHRWVNDGDIVTKIPLSPFFYHCGKMHKIDKKGNIDLNHDRNWNYLELVRDFTVGILHKFIGDLQDHSSEKYYKHLERYVV
jgi:triacylglycerol lipase